MYIQGPPGLAGKIGREGPPGLKGEKVSILYAFNYVSYQDTN